MLIAYIYIKRVWFCLFQFMNGHYEIKNMKFIITFFFILTTVTANCQTDRAKTIHLNPYMSFQNYEHFKRLTLSAQNSPIEYLEGFEFEWGYKYEINVRETELSHRLSDGTKFRHTIISVVSKTRVPDSTQFNLFLDPYRYYHASVADDPEFSLTLKPVNDSTYLYFDTVEIEVPASLREKFVLIVEGTSTNTGRFVFINEKRIRLVDLEKE